MLTNLNVKWPLTRRTEITCPAGRGESTHMCNQVWVYVIIITYYLLSHFQPFLFGGFSRCLCDHNSATVIKIFSVISGNLLNMVQLFIIPALACSRSWPVCSPAHLSKLRMTLTLASLLLYTLNNGKFEYWSNSAIYVWIRNWFLGGKKTVILYVHFIFNVNTLMSILCCWYFKY